MKKRTKIILSALMALVLILCLSFFAYVSTYYRADETATALLENSPNITVDGNLTILSPDIPSDTGLIFYPGGKVEHTAYLPLLYQLRDKGITCVLVEMPFNLAFFNKNAAAEIPGKFPQITNWYLAGHSLGGAMASAYFADNPDSINGLILLGAFIYGEVDPAKVLILYGSEDKVLSVDKIDPATQQVVVIEGGNHGQFGNYGPQKGDGTSTLSREKQQTITAEEIYAFINR